MRTWTKEEVAEALGEFQSNLTPIQKKVLELRFGIGCAPMTLGAVADRIGALNTEHVRRLERNGLLNLQMFLQMFPEDGQPPEEPPVPIGSFIAAAFRVDGYERDADGTLMAQVTHVDKDGNETGWGEHMIVMNLGLFTELNEPVDLFNRWADAGVARERF